jgi:hypothetical protein
MVIRLRHPARTKPRPIRIDDGQGKQIGNQAEGIRTANKRISTVLKKLLLTSKATRSGKNCVPVRNALGSTTKFENILHSKLKAQRNEVELCIRREVAIRTDALSLVNHHPRAAR